jgi:hypothetical protein
VRVAALGDHEVGDSLEVSAEVREFFGSTQLGFRTGINHFVNLGPATEPVTVQTVDAADIYYASWLNSDNSVEPLESAMVHLTPVRVDSSDAGTTQFGEWLLLQNEAEKGGADTAGVNLDALIDSGVTFVPCVDDSIEITGVLRYEFSEYRIAPRSDSDITVIFHGDCASSVPGDLASGPDRLWLSPARPNPFTPRTTLRFQLAERGRAGLAIYGVDGRTVRDVLAEQVLEAGTYQYVWDGRNEAGENVPSGLYFVRLLSPLGEKSEKLLLVR